jgi:hypothetical protein
VSISDIGHKANDFDNWIAAEFSERGAFTALVILVGIDGLRVAPLCSTYFSVIGDETDWAELTVLLAGSGMDWQGAAFFPVRSTEGHPLDNPTARLRLREFEARIEADRLVLNEGHFFDKSGRRMMIEEIAAQ